MKKRVNTMQNETHPRCQKNDRVLTSLSCQPGIPDKVWQKAKEMLLRYYSGERLSKKVKCSGKKVVLTGH